MKFEYHVQYTYEWRSKEIFFIVLFRDETVICTLHTFALPFTYKVFAEYEQILTDKLYE